MILYAFSPESESDEDRWKDTGIRELFCKRLAHGVSGVKFQGMS